MFLITGGTGFIGSNLAAALEARGEGEIVLCDWLGTGEKWRNVAKRNVADIIPPEELFDFLEDEGKSLSAVFHMGAITDTTENDSDLMIENNFHFSMGLWEWCTQNKKRLIYASSAATYGDGLAGFSDEAESKALARLQPLNPYGWSKHLFDRRITHLIENGAKKPPQWAGLKFFNVYGPNEYHKGRMKSVVAQIFPTAKTGRAATLFKSHHPDYAHGGQMRDFVFVDDCVNVMLWLLDNPKVSGLFNLGSGKARSFADLATAVYDALGKKTKIRYVDTPEELRARYQYFTQADMRKLKKAGYKKSFTSLEEGVGRYVRNFLNQDDPYR